MKNKVPDFLVAYPKHIFIIEAKHMKESGGGQDKQINELISFIDQSPIERSENKAHFVAFLDGVYFNKLFLSMNSRGKTLEQRRRIIEALKRHPSNYFVNSHGFKRLFSSLRDSIQI